MISNKKFTTEEFIAKSKNIFGDLYDYKKVEYVGSKIKVEIICKELKVTRIYNTIVSDVKSGKYPEGAENKYLMRFAESGEAYATWYPWMIAPDGTEGYWGARGLTRGAGGSGKNMGA